MICAALRWWLVWVRWAADQYDAALTEALREDIPSGALDGRDIVQDAETVLREARR